MILLLNKKDDQLHKLTQSALSDFEFSQEVVKLLRSRLQQWNLLQNYVRDSMYRKHQRNLFSFFGKKINLFFCCNVDGLMKIWMDQLNRDLQTKSESCVASQWDVSCFHFWWPCNSDEGDLCKYDSFPRFNQICRT